MNKGKPQPGQIVAVRKAPDAQLYYYASLTGATAQLMYVRGGTVVNTHIDVDNLRRPTPSQLKHSASDVQVLKAKTSK